MAGQPKKSFNVYQNTLKAGLTAMKKYSDTSRRGFLVIVRDNTGLHKFGTKNLVEHFKKTNPLYRDVNLQLHDIDTFEKDTMTYINAQHSNPTSTHSEVPQNSTHLSMGKEIISFLEKKHFRNHFI